MYIMYVQLLPSRQNMENSDLKQLVEQARKAQLY